MRLLLAFSLALATVSCEAEEAARCEQEDECRSTEVCAKGDPLAKEGICKLKLGELCLRHADCESGSCSAGYCRLNFNK